MTLLVEHSKNGKPLILVNNYKYRESHCLKNGDRAWRCLGGKCGATVRTNADATLLVSSGGKHQGPHLVTMRTLSVSSPQSSSTCSFVGFPGTSWPVSGSPCEVHEAELRCLKEEKRRCEFEGGPTSEWTVCQNRKPPPISTENRYKALASVTDTHQTALCPPKPSVKPSSRSNKHNKTKKQIRKSNVQLPFSSILIEGDSHSRDLAALVRRRVSRETNVEGVCRPGAKLLEATSDDLPPPGGRSVIVAGTNDVASGEEYNIYRHLERRITRKLGTFRVIVATLPHRHDLPASHRINRQTALVNNYIEECGAEVLDFNRIGRAAFTSHSMHLKRTSKHLLAELLVKCLREMSHFAPRAPSLSATAVAEPPSRPLEPPAQRPTASGPPVAILPFDSFADAVKSRLPMPQEITSTSNPEAKKKKTIIF
ncbi:hypothetical protein J6590_081790 [Homalodisca vitripennis]|nr:hypothetical protein J6590_081790 [Homalodisca vitripennis]